MPKPAGHTYLIVRRSHAWYWRPRFYGDRFSCDMPATTTVTVEPSPTDQPS